MKRLNYHLREPDKRSRFYRYDRTVPGDVQELFGKKVISFSLKVRDPVEARRLRDEWDDHFEAEWARLRQQLKLNAEARLIAEARAWRDHLRKPREPVSPPKDPLAHLLIPRGPWKPIEPFEQPELERLVAITRRMAIDRLPAAERDDEEKIRASLDWVGENTDEGRMMRRYVQAVTGRRSYPRSRGKILRILGDQIEAAATPLEHVLNQAHEP